MKDKNTNEWELGGGYWAVFKGTSSEPEIVFRPKSEEPKKIPIKLDEEDYEYLDDENPYKTHDDSTVSTVGKVDGDSSDTRSPIQMKTTRNQYWMDHSLGGGRGYSMITTKSKLGESVKILNYLTERDVIIAPPQEQPMEEEMPMEEEVPMEDPNAEMDMEDPNAEMDGMEEELSDPNIEALMQLLQQDADPKTIEAVKKYAEGVIKAKQEDMPMEEDPNAEMDMGVEEEMPMEEDPNAVPQNQQVESRQINLDEFINDYLDDTEKPIVPTVSHKIGSGGKSSLKSKMYNPLQ